MWDVLCSAFFQRYVPPSGTVLEVGAGYCEFINSIKAGRKIAMDLNPDTRLHADPGVEIVLTSSTDLSVIASGSIDVAFASNFFEHLERADILGTMREVRRVLRADGRFLILQPNYRYCYRDYWMFFDHLTPLDHHSLTEALELSGLHVSHCVARFLPYTTKSRYPRSLSLMRAYLRLPIVWRFLGQQAFVVAEVAPQGGSQDALGADPRAERGGRAAGDRDAAGGHPDSGGDSLRNPRRQ
ncbi:MAG: class I SAM-dependent methyltransferase [Chloroflexia bacterium]|nr:class I SAM-dependent methyltransferase [Chloroflexia bacterium]